MNLYGMTHLRVHLVPAPALPACLPGATPAPAPAPVRALDRAGSVAALRAPVTGSTSGPGGFGIKARLLNIQ